MHLGQLQLHLLFRLFPLAGVALLLTAFAAIAGAIPVVPPAVFSFSATVPVSVPFPPFVPEFPLELLVAVLTPFGALEPLPSLSSPFGGFAFILFSILITTAPPAAAPPEHI